MVTERVAAWPLFDVFMDVPHPSASAACAPAKVIASPDPNGSQELASQESIGRIARFAFPDYDDRATRPAAGLEINRYDVYVTKGFQHHTFSMQLSNGERVHGHVRRYLPMNPRAPGRFDVGRRGVRALVLLTRVSGGDSVYTMFLKTIEGLTAQKATVPGILQPSEKPQQAFLHYCFSQHQRMCLAYAKMTEEERKPMMLLYDGIEFGSAKLQGIDTSKFILPTSMLQPQTPASRISALTASPILPLLRCLGVPNTLRLMSALMSERRIILISSSPTRLATCARSALSMVAQGLLSWQHLFIPVLPPHLLQYLQAPMPYLVGILSGLFPTVNKMPDLGELLLINLDQNALETRNIPQNLIASRIPDLFLAMRDETNPNSIAGESSSAQLLASDLIELLKMDKRLIFGGESAMENVQETAKAAAKAVKSAFGKLKNRGKKLLQGNDSFSDAAEKGEEAPPAYSKAVTDDEIYIEGCQNELGEEEARIAFAAFFLNLYGDLRWYLGNPQPGQIPQLDRDRFLQQKKRLGEGEWSPMYPLLQNMCHSQMFEEFVKDRVNEIQSRVPVTKDSPLFLVCANYHRKHQIDYSIPNVRRVTRQVAQVDPSRIMSQANANARRNAMALTSNKTFEGNQGHAVAQLVEACHETSVMNDVASVIWLRLRDSKGMNWKHGLMGLQILRNLLYHGPISAIPEATDGLDKIRALKSYHDNMRGQICQQIRAEAFHVYDLLVDRAKLFAIRRVCANRRRELRSQKVPRLVRDQNLRFGVPFRNMHPYLSPSTNRQVAPAPQQSHQSQPPPPVQHYRPAAAPPTHQQPRNVGDLLGAFDSSVRVTTPTNDPFAAPIPQPIRSVAQQHGPTMAQMPPEVAPQPLVPPQQTRVPQPTVTQMTNSFHAQPGYSQQGPFGQSPPQQQPTYAQLPPKQHAPTQSPYPPPQYQHPGYATSQPPHQYNAQFPQNQQAMMQHQPGTNLFVAQPSQPPPGATPRPGGAKFDPFA